MSKILDEYTMYSFDGWVDGVTLVEGDKCECRGCEKPAAELMEVEGDTYPMAVCTEHYAEFSAEQAAEYAAWCEELAEAEREAEAQAAFDRHCAAM